MVGAGIAQQIACLPRENNQDDAQPRPHPELEEGPAEVLHIRSDLRQQAGEWGPSSSSSDVPFPLPNTPATPGPSSSDDDLMLQSLRRNPYFTLTDRPGLDIMALRGSRKIRSIPQVHVILFGISQNEQEGIYSLRAINHDGLPQETIIAFETSEDAERYAGMLEVTMDPHAPHVCNIPAEDLVNFCYERGYRCRMEPQGSLLIPPDFNVGLTDWERAKRLRSGSFDVLEIEPSSEGGGNVSSSERLQRGQQTVTKVAATSPRYSSGGSGSGSGSGSASFARYQQPMGESDLNELKRRFEALLPADDDQQRNW